VPSLCFPAAEIAENLRQIYLSDKCISDFGGVVIIATVSCSLPDAIGRPLIMRVRVRDRQSRKIHTINRYSIGGSEGLSLVRQYDYMS
jgi:hypothetical protein